MNQINPDIEKKMFQIAKYLNELNNKNKVKCRRENNFGHAKVLQAAKGCSIWVHHMHDNSLIVDTLVTETAEQIYKEACENTITKFDNYYKGRVNVNLDYRVKSMPDISHRLYFVDITTENLTSIFGELDKLKKNFE